MLPGDAGVTIKLKRSEPLSSNTNYFGHVIYPGHPPVSQHNTKNIVTWNPRRELWIYDYSWTDEACWDVLYPALRVFQQHWTENCRKVSQRTFRTFPETSYWPYSHCNRVQSHQHSCPFGNNQIPTRWIPRPMVAKWVTFSYENSQKEQTAQFIFGRDPSKIWTVPAPHT